MADDPALRTLDDLVREHGPLPVSSVCAIGRQLIAMLQPVLAAGEPVALAPPLVTIDRQGAARLLPAPPRSRGDPGRAGGHRVEQSAFEPPVYPPQDPAAVASFGVGALLFFALTGDRPFRGQVHEVIARMRQGLPTGEVARYRDDVPRVLELIIERSMAGDPAARPLLATLDKVLEQLRAFEEHQR